MSGIKSLLDQLKDKRAEAAIIPEDAPPATRAMTDAMVRNAKVDVEKLETQYKDDVMSHAVLIGVTGNGSEEFANIAKYKHGAITVDYKGIYTQIVKAMKERRAGLTYSTQEHFLLLDELNKLKQQYKFQQLPAPTINAYSDGIYDGKLEESIAKIFKNNYGNSLYSAITRRAIGEKALAEGFSGKVLSVILYNYDGGVDTKFIPNPIKVIDTEATKVDDDYVKTELLNVKKLFQKTAKKNDPSNGLTKENGNE